MKLLLTGATGFVGKEVLNVLKVTELSVLGRRLPKSDKALCFFQYNICATQNYINALLSVDIIIHCAARVHIMDNSSNNSLEAFREVNTHGTLNLAQQAADAGVKRFIFISSIKVNGESTELGKPFKPDDTYIPTDPYGLSKYEAEIGLRKIASETGMEIVIIRPPLVYGPSVKANFASMMKWVNKGAPLPLGGIKENKRSLVSVDNLVDLIVTCIEHPNAANQTFLVSDDDDVSTTGLLKNMATALNVPNRLIPIPASWFNIASKLIGKPAIAQRLCGSLQVDISKTKERLNWTPPYSSAECMKKTADAFLNDLKKKK
ncbi:UDP-glucose 4-epimerase family protein [Psychromonas hadalis]|uniref:UDP-glucose 4-epimerase family protein n=1 Tax=Psychromonas hadalis TaxID=211669 RepID=UPI00040501AD|nr:SDR family oxidoreductase [Psychromonas hadalis]